MVKILHIIKTTGIIYDDRLLKETSTLSELGAEVEIAALEDQNEIGSGKTLAGVPWKTLSLKSRKWFPSAKGLSIKSLEFASRTLCYLKKSKADVLWAHNIENLPLVCFAGLFWKPFRKARKIVWDLHEFPSTFYREKRIGQIIFNFSLSLSDIVICANQARVDELFRGCFSKFSNKATVVENFPTKEFSELPKGELPHDLKEWLNGDPFILVQGMGMLSRRTAESIEAIRQIGGFRVVILGPLNESVDRELERRKIPTDLIYVTGMVPQNELYHVIDHAYASIVFYGFTNDNNRLCAPNRLYQAVCRGVPLVCGCNPSMKNLVELHRCGIVTDGDGGSVDDIVNAVKTLISKIDAIRENTGRARSQVTWESQVHIFEMIMLRIQQSPAQTS